MKNKRILLICIPAILVISSAIGCIITFSSAPHAALARIFIDIGALVALLSITNSLPKPDPLQTDDIVDGLRDLAKNRFDRRQPIKEQDELHQVRQAFNELAGTLSDSRDPSLTHIRYNPMNRVELKVSPLALAAHSHHPELGQPQPKPQTELATEPEPEPHAQPQLELAQTPEPEHKPINEAQRPEAYPSEIGAADLFFLFERFKAAHDKPENAVDFDSFLSTVQNTREQLMRSHHCKDVKFEVVTDAGAVALRPRLIR